jgi:hypothetical protein
MVVVVDGGRHGRWWSWALPSPWASRSSLAKKLLTDSFDVGCGMGGSQAAERERDEVGDVV